MSQLPYLLEFTVYKESGGNETFRMRNAFDNIRIELHTKMGNHPKPLININGNGHFFPTNNYMYEKGIYLPARSNPSIDNRYQTLNPLSLLTGSSLVSSHLAYDGHTRLTYYHDLVESFQLLHSSGKISNATYSMLRYQAQKATKLQLSVIGQNLSEFPPFGKPIAAQKAKAEAFYAGEAELSKGAFTVRKSTDSLSKVFRGVGTGIVVLSAAQSVYNIATSSQKMNTASKELGGWAGSLSAGELGMQAGAEIGGSVGLFFGVGGFAPGAAIGGFIGGIAGGIGGYIWGYNATNNILNGLENPHASGFRGFGGGSFGGGGAQGDW